jgi:hypothetical protein
MLKKNSWHYLPITIQLESTLKKLNLSLGFITLIFKLVTSSYIFLATAENTFLKYHLSLS